MYNISQIDDWDDDGIAEDVVQHDWHLLNTSHCYGDGWNRFYSFTVEKSGTYALYVECQPNIPIKCHLNLQESPGCMILDAKYRLNKTYIKTIEVDYILLKYRL